MSAPPSPSTVPAPAERPARRPDSSMSLLVDVMTNTLDEAYADRAARRAAATAAAPEPAPRVGPVAGTVGLVALVLLGLVTGTAVAQVRDRAAAAADVREDLADEIRDRSAETDELARQAAALRTEVTVVRDSTLAADDAGRRLTEEVRALETAAATTPMTGPGIVLTVSDAEEDAAPDDSEEGGSALDGRVLDRDLQDVVNGLWAAGAEAVAVNGVRLSIRAAIRSAGEAVLVDFRPLSPPYRLEAIGRPATLEVEFLDGPSGRRLETLAGFSGITYSVRRADRLTLPAATEPQLRAARPAPEPS